MQYTAQIAQTPFSLLWINIMLHKVFYLILLNLFFVYFIYPQTPPLKANYVLLNSEFV